MHTNRFISSSRKTLYGIMLLGIVIAAFGTSTLPTARAQEAGTGAARSVADG